MNTDLVIFEEIKHLPAYTQEDTNFLIEHKKHLQDVLVKTHMWRTDTQKRQIINDIHFPTIHSKFHQAILEQKVQFENSLYLARDFELKKIEIEETELTLEGLSDSRMDQITRRKLEVEAKFKNFELQQMRIAMNYRMAEIRGWQEIIDELYSLMKSQGLDDSAIWSKNQGEFSAMFFVALNNAAALKTTTDSAEYSNIVASLQFVISQAKAMGILESLKKGCSQQQISIIEKFSL